jgi:predicted phage terminase large subunit-like protein
LSSDLSESELIYLRDLLQAEFSLHEFIKQAWPIIEGDVAFVDGWHIQAICEHLEATVNRQIKNLIINMPPRCCKSSLVSIAFPAWVWIHNPGTRFMYTSYAKSLSLKHSLDCRRLISSSWYHERWGNKFKLMKDQNAKGRFDNDKKGYRIATSVGAATTGEGANILVVDDGNNVRDGESDVKREGTLDWFTKVWSTRLNDKKNDCQIVIQQRIHERDISGFILGNDELNEWTKLILPMEFEESRRSKTIVLPTTDKKIWEDPRQKDGQLLWPERITVKELESLKQALGSEYAISGQLQQRPSPEAGGIIKKSWFKWWKDYSPPQIEYVIQSWDTALTAKEMSAYSACTTWGVFYDHNNIENIILLSMWRDRIEYPQLREMAKRLYFDYRDTGKERNPLFKGRKLDMFLIEAKASGDPLIQDLASAGIRAIPFNPSKYGDKIQRVRMITHLIEGGLVWLPAKSPNFESLVSFADIFQESVAAFPNAESRDLVDTMTQALLKLKDSNFILPPRDERYIQPSVKTARVY